MSSVIKFFLFFFIDVYENLVSDCVFNGLFILAIEVITNLLSLVIYNLPLGIDLYVIIFSFFIFNLLNLGEYGLETPIIFISFSLLILYLLGLDLYIILFSFLIFKFLNLFILISFGFCCFNKLNLFSLLTFKFLNLLL